MRGIRIERTKFDCEIRRAIKDRISANLEAQPRRDREESARGLWSIRCFGSLTRCPSSRWSFDLPILACSGSTFLMRRRLWRFCKPEWSKSKCISCTSLSLPFINELVNLRANELVYYFLHYLLLNHEITLPRVACWGSSGCN